MLPFFGLKNKKTLTSECVELNVYALAQFLLFTFKLQLVAQSIRNILSLFDFESCRVGARKERERERGLRC